MREIIFRGKRIDNGKWIHGYLNATIRKDCACISDCWETQGVIPDTVGQYTGMNDKDGIDIFEGDIVRWTRHNVNAEGIHNITLVEDCTIYWNDAKHAFWMRYDFETCGAASGMLNFEDIRAEYVEFEVIGNIYDNPELLKGGEE